MEYLLQFNFDIRYVKGITNKVVDAISRHYELDTSNDKYSPHEYINADIHIDKELNGLP